MKKAHYNLTIVNQKSIDNVKLFNYIVISFNLGVNYQDGKIVSKLPGTGR